MFAYCINNPVSFCDSNGNEPKESIDTDGDGEIDCYVYEYTYSTFLSTDKKGRVYVYTNCSGSEDLLKKEKPDGFNSSSDIMVAYYVETDGDERNAIMFAANAHKVKEKHRSDIIDCFLKFDEDFNTEWNRTKESLLIEWKGHHKWRIAPSARHIDFDNAEEGMPLEYYNEKAWKRFKKIVSDILPW
jgi:hypothetical protein